MIKVYIRLLFAVASGYFLYCTQTYGAQGDTLVLCLSEIRDSVISGDSLSDIEYPAYSENKGAQYPDYLSIKIGRKRIYFPLSIGSGGQKKKLTAILLTVFTGLVGGHRLYLGTAPVVPVVYAVTLGGGFGVLPFIDLIVLLLSEDIQRFENNNQIFMWVN